MLGAKLATVKRCERRETTRERKRTTRVVSEEGARMKQATLDVWTTGERGKNLESECSWAIHGNPVKTETSIQNANNYNVFWF